MQKKPTKKQVEAYQLTDIDFDGLSTKQAAKKLKISVQAVRGRLQRLQRTNPQLFLGKLSYEPKLLSYGSWMDEFIGERF